MKRTGTMVARALPVLAAAAMLLQPTRASAIDCTNGCTVPVTAEVTAVTGLDCTIVPFERGTQSGQSVPQMDFGVLDRPKLPDGSLGALGSLRHFQWFCGGTSGQRHQIVWSSGSLLHTDGTTKLADGAYIITPLNGQGGDPAKPLPVGTVVGSRSSAAVQNKTVFQSNAAGEGFTASWTVGITNDSRNGATEFIPPSQKGGRYNTQARVTLIVS